jgi:hypothetical protein
MCQSGLWLHIFLRWPLFAGRGLRNGIWGSREVLVWRYSWNTATWWFYSFLCATLPTNQSICANNWGCNRNSWCYRIRYRDWRALRCSIYIAPQVSIHATITLQRSHQWGARRCWLQPLIFTKTEILLTKFVKYFPAKPSWKRRLECWRTLSSNSTVRQVLGQFRSFRSRSTALSIRPV